MLTAEQLSQASGPDTAITRRSFLRVATGFGLCAAISPHLLFPREARAEEWVTIAKPMEDQEWFPLSVNVAKAQGRHTLYEPGGPLDIYDFYSTLAGEQTNFRQQIEDFRDWYFATYPKLPPVLRDTTGFCHGVANASAYGEPEPVGDERVSRLNKIGLLTALHSGDSMYRPGIEQLIEDLISNGVPFVAETKDSAGYWSRVVYGVNASRSLVKATDFGRTPKILSINEIQNAYVPVPEGEEFNYPAQAITSVPEKWRIRLDKRLVRYLVYGEPLS